MKNFGKKLLIGTSVVAASAALGALLYKRYMDDFYEYVMDEDCMDEMDEEMEFAMDRLDVTIRNAPLAPSDPKNAQRFEADAVVRLEVPVRFGGKLLPSMVITLKVQAGYIEVF